MSTGGLLAPVLARCQGLRRRAWGSHIDESLCQPIRIHHDATRNNKPLQPRTGANPCPRRWPRWFALRSSSHGRRATEREEKSVTWYNVCHSHQSAWQQEGTQPSYLMSHRSRHYLHGQHHQHHWCAGETDNHEADEVTPTPTPRQPQVTADPRTLWRQNVQPHDGLPPCNY
mgnify:CR=1 FL=1